MAEQHYDIWSRLMGDVPAEAPPCAIVSVTAMYNGWRYGFFTEQEVRSALSIPDGPDGDADLAIIASLMTPLLEVTDQAYRISAVAWVADMVHHAGFDRTCEYRDLTKMITLIEQARDYWNAVAAA